MAGDEDIFELIGKFPYGFKDVVETGTFLGHSTRKFCKGMNWVHTIEVNEELYEFAKKGLEEKGCGNLSMYLGDSAKILPEIIKDYNDNHPDVKVVFYLDAHWSGDETVKEYKNGYTGPKTWIGDFSGHRGGGDKPTSKEQIPLEEEIMHIYDHFENECLVVIDDIDKFDETGKGLVGLSFEEEDWSCVNLKTIMDNIAPRRKEPLDEFRGRLLIKLESKNG
tara:strand:- start:1058 stop:1723 length:666 start_codon:yes stop_codon:yes gene_type:complete